MKRSVSPLDSFMSSKGRVPVELPAKSDYFAALFSVENCFTGRLDAWIANTFVAEAVQLVTNAINLFEMGYFDCAFYSLRQSLELSTTMVYLVDAEDETRDQELQKWRGEGRFPMYAKMSEFLKKNGLVFEEMAHRMSGYFAGIKDTKNRLNKFVHKQGFDKFYVSRNHVTNSRKPRDTLRQEFETHLVSTIGAIAVFRLAIDPYPVLLEDEEIFHRTGDLLTEPLDTDFLDRYVGRSAVDAYKQTEFYRVHYEGIMQGERKHESVTHLVKDHYIDTSKIDEIMEQIHLVDFVYRGAAVLCTFTPKVTKVYAHNGLMLFFTDRNTWRKKTSWDSRDFAALEANPTKWNLPYDESFVSCVELFGNHYQIEHNGELDSVEVAAIEVGLDTLNKMWRKNNEETRNHG